MRDRPTLLLTRPLAAARRFLAACEAARGEPVRALLSPVMAIRPVPVRLAQRPAALILTSENGAAAAGDPLLRVLPAWCVGPRTAAAARDAGLAAVEVGPDAEALLARLLAVNPSGPLLHLRGEHTRGDVVARLRAGGLDASEVVAYRQEALRPTSEARVALDGSAVLVVPLFSPRSALLLTAWQPRAPLRVVAMSGAVAQAAGALEPERREIAVRPDEEAMVEATLRALDAPGPVT